MDDITGRALSFSYGKLLVLDGLDLSTGTGITGVLGVNGAGKTTLLRLLSTAAQPSAGDLTILGRSPAVGRDLAWIRRRLGYMPQETGYPSDFTVEEFLRYFAWLHGVAAKQRRSRIDDALEIADLTSVRATKLRRLSGGMRKRALFAQAIVHQPAVLILDEPTAGLDPEQRVKFRKAISTYAADRTVILSTHLVEDVRALADAVLVIHGGRIVFSGTADALAALGHDAAEDAHDGAHPLELGFQAILASSRLRG